MLIAITIATESFPVSLPEWKLVKIIHEKNENGKTTISGLWKRSSGRTANDKASLHGNVPQLLRKPSLVLEARQFPSSLLPAWPGGDITPDCCTHKAASLPGFQLQGFLLGKSRISAFHILPPSPGRDLARGRIPSSTQCPRTQWRLCFGRLTLRILGCWPSLPQPPRWWVCARTDKLRGSRAAVPHSSSAGLLKQEAACHRLHP